MTKGLEIRGTLLARNTLLNLAGQVIPLLIGVATIPYVVRGLGTERFGILSIAWVLLGYFSLFDLGLGRATTKFVAEALGRHEAQKLPGLVWTSLAFQVLSGLVGSLVVAALTPLLVERVLKIPAGLVAETKLTFFVLAVSLPVVLATNALRGVLEAAQRFDLVNYIKLPASASVFLLPAIALPFGLGLPGIVVLLVLARLGATLGYLGFCLRLFPVLRHRPSFDSTMVRPLVGFGGWVTISNVIGPLLTYMDRLLIGALISIAAVGYYTAPYEAITRLWILPGSLTATLFPAFSSMGASDTTRAELGRLYARSVKSLLLVMGPLVALIIVFAPQILGLWLGQDFAEKGTLAMQILSLGLLVSSLGSVPFSLLQGTGRPDLSAKFHLLELPIYAVLAWSLIGSMGIAGAALAWTLRFTLDTILHFVAAAKLRLVPLGALAQKGLVRSMAGLFVLGLVLALAVLLAGALPRQLLLATLLVASFGFAAWSFFLDSSERRILASTFSQLVATFGRAK
jgi:O-antigen/teichoic acid export membrane protein